jgi:N-acetylmuramoyl-L-alanine amidase
MNTPTSIRFTLTIITAMTLFLLPACSSPQIVSTPPINEDPSQKSTKIETEADTFDEKTSMNYKVIIDPGHGGKEIGAKGKVSGIEEKDINLQVALLVKQDLESAGYSVILTRHKDEQYLPGDAKADLSARAQLAKSVGASLFVSIHADQYLPDSKVHGTKVYYYSEGSKEIAQQFHDELTLTLQSKPLGIHVNDFIILKENSVPAVLIELGFLTNAVEELKLTDPEYQLKAAQSISKVIQLRIAE